MPLIWMEAGLPPTWLMAHWPATPQTTVNQTTGGAVLDASPPYCAFTSGAASRLTAVDTGTVWTDAVAVRRAGRAPPVTLWCVSHQPAAPTGSAPPVVVSVMLDGEERTAAKSACLVSLVTAAIKPAPVSTAVPVTPSTGAVPAPLVSTATPVNKRVFWVSTARPVLRSVAVTTGVHVTRRQEAVTPRCEERPTIPYTELDIVWPNRCLHLGDEMKKLTESSLI